MQVNTTANPDKCSYHLVIYVPGLTPSTCKVVAEMMDRKCMELPVDHPDKPALVYMKVNKNGEQPVESVFDPAVYHRKSSLRILYNHKLGRHVGAVPAFGSSEDIIAHFVCVDAESFTPPEMTPSLHLTTAASSASAASAAEPRMEISDRCIIDTNAEASTSAPIPTWQPSYATKLLSLIRDHEGIRAKLGGAPLRFQGIVANGGGDTCCIPISQGPTCPYADRIHTSNHLYLLYTHSTKMVSLRCHNGGCKKRGCFHAWHVNVVTPDASTTPSLHSCEHLIPFEDYHKPTMDEFPTDASIAVIVGAMGMGKCYS